MSAFNLPRTSLNFFCRVSVFLRVRGKGIRPKPTNLRDVKVSRPAWSRDHFLGLGLALGLTVIGLGLGLGLMR